MALRFPARCKDTSSTISTSTYVLADSTALGWRNLTRAVVDGDMAHLDTVGYAAIDATVTNAAKLVEIGIGQYNNTAKTLTRVVNQPNGTPISWGVGVRDIFIIDNPHVSLLASANLSDLGDLTTALQNLGIIPTGQSGGTDGLVVRMSAANTWVNAANTDTIAQLLSVMMKANGRYYPPGSIVSGLSGLTGASAYYLDAAGTLVTSPDAISSSVRELFIGVALNSTTLMFNPGIPIGG